MKLKCHRCGKKYHRYEIVFWGESICDTCYKELRDFGVNMGTGIGKKCERCGDQLNYDDGFVLKEDGVDFDLCNKCNYIYEFDKKTKPL